LGVNQSLINCNFGTNVHIDLRKRSYYKHIKRISSDYVVAPSDPLKIFQMTDIHVGSFISIQRIKHLSEKIISLNPDLVILTGDFYTIETRNDDDALYHCLEPFKNFKGKVFACLGNHDYEQLEAIKDCLKRIDIELLVDQSTVVETRLGKVEILGAEYYFHDPQERTSKLFELNPRSSEVILHLTLLHNPLHFYHIRW